MNTMQNIIMMLISVPYYDLFHEDIDGDIKTFIAAFKKSTKYFENLRIQKLKHGEFALIWDMDPKTTVGCHIDSYCVQFSQIKKYDKEDNWLSRTFPFDNEQVLAKQQLLADIEAIKTLFMMYSIDAQVYFK